MRAAARVLSVALLPATAAPMRVCGNYCGPDWCDGKKIPESQCDDSVAPEAGSCADACCRVHDRCCGHDAQGPCNRQIVACLDKCKANEMTCTDHGMPVSPALVKAAMDLVKDWCCGAPCAPAPAAAAVVPAPPAVAALSLSGTLAAAEAAKDCAAKSGYHGRLSTLLQEAKAVNSGAAAQGELATAAGRALCATIGSVEACLKADGEAGQPLVAPIASAARLCAAAAAPSAAAPAPPPVSAAAGLTAALEAAEAATKCAAEAGYAGKVTALLKQAAAVADTTAAARMLATHAGRVLCGILEKTEACLVADGEAAQPLLAPIRAASQRCAAAAAAPPAVAKAAARAPGSRFPLRTALVCGLVAGAVAAVPMLARLHSQWGSPSAYEDL